MTLPSSPAGDVPVGLIGHLESPDQYCRVLSAARGPDLPALQPAALERLLPRLPPFPITEGCFRSPRGPSVRAHYVDLCYLVGAEPALKAGLARVRRACAEVQKSGARVAALGGFSSILGEMSGADLSSEFGLAFTTGNALTAGVLAAQVESAAEPGLEIVVVGAAGDVGSGLCRMLAQRGRRLVLVGRGPRGLAELARELPRARVSDWAEAAPQARVVVLVASTALGALSLEALPEAALVLDAGHPANGRYAAHALCASRLRYARAGRVSHACVPQIQLPALVADYAGADETHACLAEAVVLGFEQRFEPYSRGRGCLQPERISRIFELAERHGIRPGALRWARGAES